jgi:hypothetical protein
VLTALVFVAPLAVAGALTGTRRPLRTTAARLFASALDPAALQRTPKGFETPMSLISYVG